MTNVAKKPSNVTAGQRENCHPERLVGKSMLECKAARGPELPNHGDVQDSLTWLAFCGHDKNGVP